MKKLPLSIQMILVLVTISALSGMILAVVWQNSKEKIALNQQKELENALFSINPAVKRYTSQNVPSGKIYDCYDDQKTLINRFFIGTQNGFQGAIKLGISVNPAWTSVDGIRILDQTETPGLGSKITENAFLDKFDEIQLNTDYPYIHCQKTRADKSRGQVQAITGATISSKAVVKIINDTILVIKKEAH